MDDTWWILMSRRFRICVPIYNTEPEYSYIILLNGKEKERMASWAEGAEWFGILTTSATSAVSSIISYFLSSWWWKHYENFKQQYIPCPHNLRAEEGFWFYPSVVKSSPTHKWKECFSALAALLSYYRRGSNSETWRPVWTMKPRLHFVHPKCSDIWDPRLLCVYSHWEVETYFSSHLE